MDTSTPNVIDPILRVSFAIHSSPGVYALLLGSGVSRGAGIPTGWEIINDLVRKVAAGLGEDCGDDPAKWYRKKFDTEPDYSEIIQQLGASPAQRRHLLHGYFEPTDEERERNLKVPTAAHRGIANLMKQGFLRVVITTNFDRLVETALNDAGVAPSIISSQEAARGAVPLVHSTCTLLKLHGDYMDTRIRNTTGELERYDAVTTSLLNRILDEFGLIVCGWSAEWDPALRSAIERKSGRRYNVFWMSRGSPSPRAKSLIDHLSADVVSCPDADQFFEEVAEKVEAIARFDRPHPVSVEVAVAETRRFLEEPKYGIRLERLVTTELERLLARAAELSDLNQPWSTDEFVGRLKRIESASETLARVVSAGVYWDGGQYASLWTSVVQRLALVVAKAEGGMNIWLELRGYPALLLLYVIGITALHRKRFDTAVAVLMTTIDHKHTGKPVPLLSEIHNIAVIKPDAMKEAVLELKQRKTPHSDYLVKCIRPLLEDTVRDDERYEKTFDRWEYLAALAYVDQEFDSIDKSVVWVPVGRFLWHTSPPTNTWLDDDKEALNGLLTAGLFRGSQERYDEIQAAVQAFLSRHPNRWG